VTLYIFNPEHDLCLANGDRNFVPPASALAFASQGKGIMSILYGDAACVVAADELCGWIADNGLECVDSIVPWGWDYRVRQMALRAGVAPSLLPSDEYIDMIVRCQHRTRILPLQEHARCAKTVEEVEALLTAVGRIVLKAPLSGAGRGLRWVDATLSEHDRRWIEKTAAMQQCVIVEERLDVADDFAIEFWREADSIVNMGLSLFATQSGVYRHNILLNDDAIRERLHLDATVEMRIAKWLMENLDDYCGPVGVDMMRTTDGRLVVGEINLRHTMGMVAHKVLQMHPEQEGRHWLPAKK